MTKVQFSKEGSRLGLSAQGHATGSDVVCGIVSAVIQGLVTALRNGEALGLSVRDLRVELRPGCARVSCRGGRDVEGLFDLCKITLAQVAMCRPEVSVVE